jgi:predicted PurR-regulated permease PerM
MNWLLHTLTFPVMMAFIIGMLAGQIANWVQYRMRLRKDPSKVVKRSSWEVVISLMAIVVLAWIMVSTNQARNCAITLNKSLSVEIQAGKTEREAFQSAITQSLQLPPDIQALPNNDPVKQAATKPITDKYLAAVAEANKLRTDNQGAQDAAKKACGVK